uniref:Plasmolipin n=1 Tax=Petromyzon marinus TaxID=7757 RepID=A0AAJ7XGG0_PETMA|nr:plasmolipin-like [Petromyzon marinus]
MASVNTHATTATTATTTQRVASVTCTCNFNYLRSADGILAIVELVSGFLVWALISDTNFSVKGQYIWVMLVAVLFWILTALLFIFELTALHCRIPHFRVIVFSINAIGSVLYLSAFIANAASVTVPQIVNNWAASAFFAALTTIAYILSALLGFATLKGLSMPLARSREAAS